MLSVKRVQRLTTKGRYYDVGHGGVRGFCLQVSAGGAKSWLLRFQLDGKKRWMGLGSFPTFSLSEARERARRERQKLADGIDPLQVRRHERAARKAATARMITFRECAEQFHRLHEHEWRSRKHAAQVITTLRTFAFPVLGTMNVADITTSDILKVIEPLWISRNVTASRLRGRIEAVLAWATVRDFRTGDNPARWRGHLAEALPKPSKVAKVEHFAAMPYSAIPLFMQQLRQRQGVAARALEFGILSCARSGEVTGARWPEIDFGKRLWTVPPQRMKAGKEHRVCLSAAAVELLKGLPREGDGDGPIFIGARAGAGLSHRAMQAVLVRMGHTDITVHGMRSTFRDWCAEQTNYPNHVAEMALAHSIGDKTEAAYRRGDLLKKRFLLAEAWAKYCFSPPVEKSDNKVVQFK